MSINESDKNSSVVDLCRDLVRLRSFNPPGDERVIAEYCGTYLEKLGFEVQFLAHSDSRASALARLRGTGQKPGLLICSHIDTVPVGSGAWQHDPFGGHIVDGKVWGRGASDMKGGLSAALAAASVLARQGHQMQGDLWLAMTAGEEVDFLGARTLAELREDILPLQAILLPEPSDNQVYIAQKGALWLEITMFGKTAHGSMPQYGVNALLLIVELINRLCQLDIPFSSHPLLGGFTMAPTTIHGGIKTNVIPDECTLAIDMRTVPGQNNLEILEQVRRLANDVADSNPGAHAEVKVLNNASAVMTDENHPVVHAFCKTVERVTKKSAAIRGVNYFTDSAVLTPAWNVPMLIFGPGKDSLAHQPNEYVEIHRLEECVQIFTEVIQDLLG